MLRAQGFLAGRMNANARGCAAAGAPRSERQEVDGRSIELVWAEAWNAALDRQQEHRQVRSRPQSQLGRWRYGRKTKKTTALTWGALLIVGIMRVLVRRAIVAVCDAFVVNVHRTKPVVSLG